MAQSRISVLFLGLLSAFSLLTFDLYQPSIPHITEYFNSNPSLSQLSLSIYLFIFGISQLVWGPLVDHYGRRTLLPASLILAIFASLLCAFAPSMNWLIMGRALQGLALCCASLISVAAARDFEDSLERAKVLSYISMIISASPILAPILGSIIFTYLGWQANFLVMATIALFLWTKCNNELLESPFWSPSKKPIQPKKVLADYEHIISVPAVWFAGSIMMLGFTAIMLSVINSSYLIIKVLGFSPLGFGIIFLFNGLNIIVGNYLGIGLRRYFSMPTTIYLGALSIIIGGCSMLLAMKYQEFNLLALSFALISNLGLSISAPPTMSIVLSDFKENTGLVVAFITALRMFGSSFLSLLVGYFLLQDLEALPWGLIMTGLACLYCSWRFNQLTAEDEDSTEDAMEFGA